jgi:ABC-type branched-subunit amino acid transport system ATPase component
MFGSVGAGLTVPQPSLRAIGLTGSDKSYFYLCLVLAIVTTSLVLAINRSRLGRLLRALSDSPVGLATNGTSTHITRVLVFCISAFIAAIAGALAAGAIGEAGGESYQPITSLVYFALIIISVGGVPWYALIAAAGLTIVPSYLTDVNTSNWLQVLFGVAAIAYAMTPAQAKMAPTVVCTALDRLCRRTSADAVVFTDQGSGQAAQPARVPAGSLRVDDLRVTFGGIVAVDGASLEVPTGRITGLIGPNGAGKTTTFNACSGLNRPARGRVTLDGVEISRRSAASRARRGLGRTFQQMELFDNQTVWDNVALGSEARHAGLNALQHLVSSPGTKRRVKEATFDALRQCDLLPLAHRTAGSLSTGQRRLVELARCLAGPFHVLLLDEPSSGLDRVETARFGEILLRAVAERGVGILLVEHDMALVTDVCDYIYVLDFGRPIFEGTAPEVMSSPIVQTAYLGEIDVDEAARASDTTVEISP